MEEPGVGRKADAVEEVAASELRERLTELMNRAGFGNERFSVTVHGKPVAALVGNKDFERLRALDGAAA